MGAIDPLLPPFDAPVDAASRRHRHGRTRGYPEPVEHSRAPVVDEIGAIVRQLSEIAESLRGEPSPTLPSPKSAHRVFSSSASDGGDAHAASAGASPDCGGGGTSAAPDYLALARKAYADRRRRNAVFGEPEIFGEPAWDILLDLYIAHGEGQKVSVSSACIGSAAPPTTGLRWLKVLEERGLVEREADPRDQRRVLVRLSEKAIAAMEQYFARCAADARGAQPRR